MSNGEQRTWTLMHTIIVGMGALVSILLITGITAITNKIDTGDALINKRLDIIVTQNQETTNQFILLAREVTGIKEVQIILKQNQDERIKREINRR